MEKRQCSWAASEYVQNQTKYEVTLQNLDLWLKFHTLDTEMIITKAGRRMFPPVRTQVKGLDPNKLYCLLLEFTPVSNSRYRYGASTGWAAAGPDDIQSPHRIYVHPESPSTGKHWMSSAVSFGRVKLTNTQTPPVGHVVLNSMHRYQPKVVIVETSDVRAALWTPSVGYVFPETQFIAVTAYQNERITHLKIEYNPFAKGFRENGQSSKSKAKRKKSDDLEEQPQVKRSPVADPHQEISSSSDNGPSSPSSSSSSVEVNRYSPAQRFNYAPIVSYVPYCPPYNFGWYQPPMGWYRAVVPQQTERSENVPNERQVQEAPRRLTDFSVDTILGLR